MTEKKGKPMPELQVRKIVAGIEEIFHENGPPPPTPRKRGWCLAVIKNPFAGQYLAEIQHLMDDLKPLGMEMAQRLISALGTDPARIDGYGKGIIVGGAGELEHAALWHAPGGYSMREHLPDSLAIVPSTKKVGGPGTRLDVPVTHKTASYVRSHFDSVEVGIDDSPRANEMLLALVMTVGPRIHSRSGGLEVSGITARDGQK
jgi:Amino acid synthesis